MAIKLTQMKCPNCGGDLNFEGDHDQVFCTYCGTRIMVSDENKHEVTYRYVDEAAIAREQTNIKKLETEQQKSKNDMKLMLILFGFILAICIGAGLFMLIWKFL